MSNKKKSYIDLLQRTATSQKMTSGKPSQRPTTLTLARSLTVTWWSGYE